MPGLVLVQPAGSELRSVVRVRFVAALPSSVVKLTDTGCAADPKEETICPVGELTATTLLFGGVVAA